MTYNHYFACSQYPGTAHLSPPGLSTIEGTFHTIACHIPIIVFREIHVLRSRLVRRVLVLLVFSIGWLPASTYVLMFYCLDGATDGVQPTIRHQVPPPIWLAFISPITILNMCHRLANVIPTKSSNVHCSSKTNKTSFTI